MKNINSARLVLNIGEELDSQLKNYVERLNTTKTAIVKIALEEFLSKKNATTIQSNNWKKFSRNYFTDFWN